MGKPLRKEDAPSSSSAISPICSSGNMRRVTEPAATLVRQLLRCMHESTPDAHAPIPEPAPTRGACKRYLCARVEVAEDVARFAHGARGGPPAAAGGLLARLQEVLVPEVDLLLAPHQVVLAQDHVALHARTAQQVRCVLKGSMHQPACPQCMQQCEAWYCKIKGIFPSSQPHP